MSYLHFNPEEHFKDSYKMLIQFLPWSPETNAGDHLEYVGYFLSYCAKHGEFFDLCKEIIDGLDDLYNLADRIVLPRGKSMKDDDPNLNESKPDLWRRYKGTWLRVTDVSHAQIWYVWQGLIEFYEATEYLTAKVLADEVAQDIIENGYKIKWDGKVTRTGDFFPIYPSGAQIRAMAFAKHYNKRVPIRSRFLYATMFSWIKIVNVVRPIFNKIFNKKDKADSIDCWGLLSATFFMKDKKKTKKLLTFCETLIKETEYNFLNNSNLDPDVIQRDCKHYIIENIKDFANG